MVLVVESELAELEAALSAFSLEFSLENLEVPSISNPAVHCNAIRCYKAMRI